MKHKGILDNFHIIIQLFSYTKQQQNDKTYKFIKENYEKKFET